MKSFKLLMAAAFAAVITVVGVSVAMADSPGQLTNGPTLYVVKNITQGGAYATSINAGCGDTVQYSAEVDNAAYGGLTNIVVKAPLATVTTVTETPAEGASAGSSGTMTVNFSSGSLGYVSGSTKLYNSSGAVISTLPDGIATGGVNIGNLAGSTTEFVNFQAKVNCATTPTPSPTPVAAKTKALPNTGPGDIFEAFAGASTVGAAGHYFVSRRRK